MKLKIQDRTLNKERFKEIILKLDKNNSITKLDTYFDDGELDFGAVVVAVVLIILIIILGTIGNSMTILAVRKNKKLQTVSNVFIVNLSICDIIDLCCVLPFNIYSYIADGWFLNEELCKFIGFLGYTVTGTTVMTITFIAYNRYKLVLDSGRYNQICTKTNVTLVLIAGWIIPAIFLVPALVGVWGKFDYVPMQVSCNLAMDHNSQSFKLFLLAIRAVIPCVLILYLYVMIFLTTHASHKRLSTNSSQYSSMDIHNDKKGMRLTKMVLAIFVVFIISYFPCTVTGMIDWGTMLSKNFHMFCAMSVYLGSALNPLIYGLMNRQFKKAFVELCPCFQKKSDVKYTQECLSKTHLLNVLKHKKNNDVVQKPIISTTGVDNKTVSSS